MIAPASQTLTIAISGIAPDQISEHGTAIAKALRGHSMRNGQTLRLLALAHDFVDGGIFLQWLFDEAAIVPSPNGHAKACLEAILELNRRTSINVLIPGDERHFWFFVKYAEQLRAAGIQTMLPEPIDAGLCCPDELSDIASTLNVDSPVVRLAMCERHLIPLANCIGFPLYVTSETGEASVCRHTYDLLALGHHVADEHRFPVALQSIPEGDVYQLAGVSRHGRMLGHAVMKVIRRGEKDRVLVGVSIDHPELDELAQAFVKTYAWHGAFCIQVSVKDAHICVTSVRACFPEWVGFAAELGCNLPGLLVNSCSEETTDDEPKYPSRAISNQLYVCYFSDMVSSLASINRLARQADIMSLEMPAERHLEEEICARVS